MPRQDKRDITPRRDTKSRLMDAGEQLFSRHGLEAVTVRQINRTAGQRNTSSLLYHFGSKEGLIEAIFVDRFAGINARRHVMLDAISQPEHGDIVAALARAVAGEARSDVRSDPPLVPVSRATPLPLSFAQQRLWFLHRLEPASPVYNMPAALYLPGRLDRAAFAAALGEVARRHEVLRTRFVAVEGEPVQVVDPPAPVPVPEIDLAGLPAARRLEEARRLAREEALLPFDCARGPLLRTALVRLGEAEQLLLLTMHHIVSDGWSMGVLQRELLVARRPGMARRLLEQAVVRVPSGRALVAGPSLLDGELVELAQQEVATHRVQPDPLPILALRHERRAADRRSSLRCALPAPRRAPVQSPVSSCAQPRFGSRHGGRN